MPPTQTFQQVFGQHNARNSKWDAIHFNNQNLNTTNKYIAWIDLMGAANAMMLSLPKASNFVAKVHCTAQKAQVTHQRISVHPITDGFFATADDWGDLIRFLRRSFLTLANLFSLERYNQHRFIIRGAIAYGPFIDGTSITAGFGQPQPTYIGNNYMHNVMIGSPLSWAYKAESKAPPFGIYVDQSVLTFSPSPIGSPLHYWWNLGNQTEKDWAKNFGRMVLRHFQWQLKNANKTIYPVEKHEFYIKQITEYFNL